MNHESSFVADCKSVFSLTVSDEAEAISLRNKARRRDMATPWQGCLGGPLQRRTVG
ncbi:hypothetical protein [Noviherbaspirillum saxi]|uniref:hypothetical protein n=1 Tax=Noviherbaspirillum saxi TaxID=2320863 RepID=UPI001314B063|nr:hypothetical protein [Noviherbaspirillum saxi]